MTARARGSFLSSLAALLVLAAPSAASAINLTGTWNANYHCETGWCAGSDFPATGVKLTQAAGSDVVEGTNAKGTLCGMTFTFAGSEGGYTYKETLTVAADGNSWSGTLTDSNGTSGTDTATRVSGGGLEGGPPCGGEEPASKGKEAEKKGPRPTGTSVICNYEIATSEDVCGASVGDAGAGAPVTPTGTVKFSATTGGFASGVSCSLAATPLSPQVASCTVVFFASESKLPTVTAAYGGDSTHSGSTGSTQFLTAGLEEASLSQSGPSGRYPNELQLETSVPAAGTTLETTVQTHESRPQPVPMSQPPVTGLDTVSANDLRVVEALGMLADLDGLQNASVVKQLNSDVEKLDARAVEVSHSANPSEVAEAKRLLNETTAEIEALTRMEKMKNEAMLEIGRGGGLGTGNAAAEAKLEKADVKTVELLQSPSPAEQSRAQHDLEQNTRVFEQLTKQLQKREEVTKEVARSIKASVARKHGARLVLVRTLPLGRLVAKNLPAGKQHLAVRLDRARMKAATRSRTSLPVFVRTVMFLPSKLFRTGLPRVVLQPLTLTRKH